MSIQTAKAVVTLTIEVRSLGSWGEDCTVGQIRKQVVEAALNRMRKLGKENNFVVLERHETKVEIREAP